MRGAPRDGLCEGGMLGHRSSKVFDPDGEPAAAHPRVKCSNPRNRNDGQSETAALPTRQGHCVVAVLVCADGIRGPSLRRRRAKPSTRRPTATMTAPAVQVEPTPTTIPTMNSSAPRMITSLLCPRTSHFRRTGPGLVRSQRITMNRCPQRLDPAHGRADSLSGRSPHIAWCDRDRGWVVRGTPLPRR